MNGWARENAPLKTEEAASAEGLGALPWVILVAVLTVIVAMVVLL